MAFAPAATPTAVTNKLIEALSSPAVTARMTKEGFDPTPSSPNKHALGLRKSCRNGPSSSRTSGIKADPVQASGAGGAALKTTSEPASRLLATCAVSLKVKCARSVPFLVPQPPGQFAFASTTASGAKGDVDSAGS